MDWQNVATYVYDEINRMVEGKNEQGEYSLYTYNGLGVRVARELIMLDNTHGYTDFHKETPTVDAGITKAEVVKESYVIDYTSATFDPLTMDEVGGFNYRYVYGLDKLSVKITSEGTNWWGQHVTNDILKDYYHQDRMGSTTNLTDKFGRVVGRADYNEWGQITYKDALDITSSYRRIYPQLNYTGHDWDDVLGMYYAKARFYSADDKRFVAMDPIKGSITDPLSMVSYLYCVDNPLRWVDPLGLFLVGTVLREGAFSDDTWAINNYLYENSYLNYDAFVFSGSSYTYVTTSAVKQFQRNQGLLETGTVDITTWKAMGLPVNNTLQEEFDLPSKIETEYFDFLICGNDITINYRPNIYFQGAKHIIVDRNVAGYSPVITEVYDEVPDETQEKYLALFKEGISEMFANTDPDAKSPNKVLGVDFTFVINVDPKVVTSQKDATVIISMDAGRAYVDDVFLSGWSLKKQGDMHLFIGSDSTPVVSDTKFKHRVAHEFGHQVLGLDDAYMDSKWLESFLRYPIGSAEVQSNSLMYYHWGQYVITSNDVEMILWAFSTGKRQSYSMLNLSEAFYE